MRRFCSLVRLRLFSLSLPVPLPLPFSLPLSLPLSLLATLALLLVLVAPVRAQQRLGAIVGIVTDPGGAHVAAARVTLLRDGEVVIRDGDKIEALTSPSEPST